MTPALFTMIVIFPAAMAYAAASDLVSMTISNRLCLVFLAAFVICVGTLGLSWAQIGGHLAAGRSFSSSASACSLRLDRRGRRQAGSCHCAMVRLRAADALSRRRGPAGGVLTLVLLQIRAHPLPASVAVGHGLAGCIHREKGFLTA